MASPSGAATSPSAPTVAGPGAGIVTAFAGTATGSDLTVGEGGPATQAGISLADDIAVGPNGDVYVADHNTGRLLRIRDDILTALHRADPTSAQGKIAGVAVASDGAVLFTDGSNIRRISPEGGTSVVLAEAGSGFQVSGDKLAVAPDGTIYYASGRISPRVFRVGTDGTLTVVAGTGNVATEVGEDGVQATDASFGRISDLAVDSRGLLYVADQALGVVRVVRLDGTIQTVVGGGEADPLTLDDGASLTATEIRLPPGTDIGIAFGASDGLYVTHAGLSLVFRVLDDGAVEVITANAAGTGLGQPAIETQILQPKRLAVTESGDVLVLLQGGNRIWRISAAGG